ncbi:MAG: cohesin domain-containing protein [Balneola sp.]
MKYLFSALLSIFMISGVHSQITRPADFTENFNFSSGDPVYLDGSTLFFKAPRPSFWSNWYNVPFEIEAKEEGTYFLSIEGNEPTGFRLFFRGNELYNTSDKIRFSQGEKKNITLNVKNPPYSTNGGTFNLELRKNKLIGSELITTIIVGVASDETSPSASVNALSSTQSSNSFNVSWRANDSHSGVWKYDIQYRINSGPWMDWKSNVSTTSANFSGSYGATIYFRARAYDNVGNRSEYATGNGDTFTKIQAPTTLSVSPTSLSFDADGGTKSFAVTSNTTWSVSDNQSWISVSGADNNGNDSQVNVTVTSNSSTTSSRSGTVTISGGGLTRTVSVSQQGEDILDIDLIVQAIDHNPDNPVQGDDVDIEVVLQNTGSTNSGSFKWKLLLNESTVREYTEDNISANRSELKKMKVTGLAAGIYVVSVEIDSKNDVSETDEVNNKKNHTFKVESAPDKIVTSLSVNTSQSPNSEFLVDINVGSESDPVSDLYGMSFVVTYDPTILEVVGNSKGDFLGSNVTYLPIDDPSKGEFAVGITKNGSESGSNGNGVVSSVSFKVNQNIASDTKTTIRLTEIDAENPNQVKIPFAESEIEIDISTGIAVWSGDTNNDGKVDQKDVLPIGRNWQKTGPIRPNASSDWEAQVVTPWEPEDATYADASGDGTVNQKDVLPIGRNWQKMHSVNAKALSNVVTSIQNGNPPISLTTDDQVELNTNFEVSVMLGNSDSTLTNVFGSSYVINYDPEFIEYVSDQAGDFFGTSPIYFAQNDSETGSIGVGISRTSGSSSGFGKLSSVIFKLIKEVPQENETIIFLTEVEIKDVNDDDILVSPKSLIIKGKPASIVTFSLPDTTALLSNEVTLPLNIYNPDGGAFSSFEIDLDFNTSLLELTNVTKGNLTSDYSIEFNSTDAKPGLISGQGTSDINSSGNLLNLTFETVGSGTANISFNDILLNEGSPAANSISGSIEIAPYVCGDADGNGIVSANDASEILKHTVFLDPYPIIGVDSSAADVTGNGMITAYDGSLILKYDVKLIEKLNCGLSNQKGEPVFADLGFGEYSEESNKILIPITVKGISGDISSLEFSFKLSNGISNISLSSIPKNWNLSSNISGDKVYFSMYGANAISEDIKLAVSVEKSSGANGFEIKGDYRINENAKENFEPLFIEEIPNEVSLNQNYPNPFNPTTNISYSLPEKSQVRLVIYSALGQKVATLVDRSIVAGNHTVTWEAQNNASGIYFYRLFVGDVVKTQKMLLIK